MRASTRANTSSIPPNSETVDQGDVSANRELPTAGSWKCESRSSEEQRELRLGESRLGSEQGVGRTARDIGIGSLGEVNSMGSNSEVRGPGSVEEEVGTDSE